MSDLSVSELLENLDIESWLDSEGIDYKVTHGRSGTQLNIKCCPVCGSTSWKVYLNAETGLGSCFAGDHPPGENYNKFKFVQAALGTATARDTISAIEAFVAGSVWRPKPSYSKPVTVAPKEDDVPDSFPIPINGRNLAYLAKRGITTETAEYFGLRYCQSGRYFYEVAGEKKWQDYAGRIIIPVYNLDGKMVGFQGRDITGTSDRRYIFPPMMASTGRLLFNGHRARGVSRVVVNEGVFDVFATHQAVRSDASLADMIPVGTFGKHLSNTLEAGDQIGEFIELKRLGLKEVVMMWDSEPKAIIAALDACKALKKIGLITRIAILPEGCDPNEVSQDEVVKAIKEAKELDSIEEVRLRLRYARLAA